MNTINNSDYALALEGWMEGYAKCRDFHVEGRKVGQAEREMKRVAERFASGEEKRQARMGHAARDGMEARYVEAKEALHAIAFPNGKARVARITHDDYTLALEGWMREYGSFGTYRRCRGKFDRAMQRIVDQFNDGENERLARMGHVARHGLEARYLEARAALHAIAFPKAAEDQAPMPRYAKAA